MMIHGELRFIQNFASNYFAITVVIHDFKVFWIGWELFESGGGKSLPVKNIPFCNWDALAFPKGDQRPEKWRPPEIS